MTHITIYTFWKKILIILKKRLSTMKKADSIVNVLDEVDSQELITELQKQYENEKLRNDNLQLKVDRTVFIFLRYGYFS